MHDQTYQSSHLAHLDAYFRGDPEGLAAQDPILHAEWEGLVLKLECGIMMNIVLMLTSDSAPSCHALNYCFTKIHEVIILTFNMTMMLSVFVLTMGICVL